MRHLEEAFAFDIRMRRDVDESFSPDGISVVAHDIREGKVYERSGVTVTAFLVTGLVKPSYGYRVDYAGRSVALSGDTSPSDNLVAFCKGVDVLIHEAIDLDGLRRLVPTSSAWRRLWRVTPRRSRQPASSAECRRGWPCSLIVPEQQQSASRQDDPIGDAWRWATI